MKRLLLLASIGGTLLASTWVAAGPGKHDPAARFAELDTNGDGKVTTTEFRAAHVAKFKKADQNKDGTVTREELKLAHQAAHKSHVDALFAKSDANKDGRLSQEEATDLRSRRFAHLDSNGDGFVSKDEALTAKPPEHAKKRGERHFDKLDRDDNGKLDDKELEALSQHFARLDGNGDGALTVDELRAHAPGKHRGRGHEKKERGHKG
jgi:Ca2+-binding EF-hand superfamily protein